MIKAFGHTVKRAGIEILVRPNGTVGVRQASAIRRLSVTASTEKRVDNSKTICFHTLKTDVSASP